MKNLIKTGIVFALIFMIGELTYINTKSLYYLTNAKSLVDLIFSIIGSLAFSMVTVLVMMNKASKQFMKVLFPIFDIMLVFCGLNLKYAALIINGTDNPVRFWLTVFMALFAGLITYSLGNISFIDLIDKENTEAEGYKLKWYSANKQIESLKSDVVSLETNNKSYKTVIESLKGEFEKSRSQIENSRKEIVTLETELKKYKSVYMTAEKSRILKKKEENRTPEEIEILKITA